jgi:hypothetical protein
MCSGGNVAMTCVSSCTATFALGHTTSPLNSVSELWTVHARGRPMLVHYEYEQTVRERVVATSQARTEHAATRIGTLSRQCVSQERAAMPAAYRGRRGV